MKKILYICLLAACSLLSCNKQCPMDIPDCVDSWIDVVKTQESWTPPAEVHEYRYNGKRVFLLTAACCDQFNTLVDEHCDYICAPDGGITGKGDGACTDFFQKATYTRLVWKDQR